MAVHAEMCDDVSVLQLPGVERSTSHRRSSKPRFLPRLRLVRR